MEKHCDDLRSISEDDTVKLTTTGGEEIQVTCTHKQVQHADPRSGEVRETHIWSFDSPDHNLAVSVTEGLKSSPDDPDFPIHNEIWNHNTEDTMGYIESLISV